MIKKDISKILIKGSTKQKLLLLNSEFSSILSGEKPSLTENERQEISNSFKTPQEIRAYNRNAQIHRNIGFALPILEAKELEYKEAIAHLNGFTVALRDYSNTETLLNTILYQIPDKKLRNKIKKNILSSPLTYAHITENEIDNGEDLIKVNIEKTEGYSLQDMIDAFSKKATDVLTQAKTYITVMRDYLINEDVFHKGFKELFKKHEERLREDRAIIPAYRHRELEKLRADFGAERLDLLKNKYSVFPIYDELKVEDSDYKEVMEAISKREEGFL